MPFLQINAIAAKIYDLLRQDSRTRHIDWYDGRRVTYQESPAGDVYLGPGTLAPYMVPEGDRAEAQFVVEVTYGSHAGATEAERLMRAGLDDVGAVLVDSRTATGRDPWSLGLAYCYIDRLSWEPRINPEAAPPYAAVRFGVTIVILPTS